jgi:ribosomal protein L40E
MHAFPLIFVQIIAFVALFFLGWIAFLVWIVATIFRKIFSGVSALFVRRPRISRIEMQCTRMRCGASNPMNAQFCRRCGAPMMQAHNRRMAAA